MKKITAIGILCVLGVLGLTGCAAHQSYRKAQRAEQIGDWDQAVLEYLELTNRNPGKVSYRTGLLRAKIRASQSHFEKGKKFLEVEALERAYAEFQQAVQLDPTNQYAQVEMEKLREQLLRAAGDREALQTLAEITDKNRGTRPQPPLLSPRSTEPIDLNFPNQVSIFEIYKALGSAFGINILFDPKLRDQQVAIVLREVNAQSALEILMRTAGHFYKVQDEHSIIVAEDNPQNRRNYEDLVIQTFFLSNAETKEVLTALRSLVGAKNVTAVEQLNAIVIRDTADKVKVAERIIETIDKARGEVVIDVELLEITANFMQDLGVRLSDYSVGQRLDQGDGGIRVSDLEFINQSNWFLSIPTFIYNFLKSSSESELLASPQIRISDGEKATLHIGDSVPIPVTSFNTAQTVGGNIVPLTSFQYRDVGIRLDLEPRIHHNREISLKVTVEVSALGDSIQAGTQAQPVIGTRTIESTIRLKNGETNFLAGLIRTDESRDEVGMPGLSDIPVLGRLFSNKGSDKRRTDLVLTLTPHIIRTADIVENDLLPIWVGTEANITFRGDATRVESDIDGPFDGDEENDAQRIREMIRRRIQNLPRGLQDDGADDEPEAPPGVDLAPAAAPSDPFSDDDDDGDDGGNGMAAVPAITAPPVPGFDDEVVVSDFAISQTGGASAEDKAAAVVVDLKFMPSLSKVTAGDEFEVAVWVKATKKISHLPMTLSYDGELLSVVSVENGEFFGVDRSETMSNFSTAGRIILGSSRLGKGPGVKGEGVTSTIRFRAEKAGFTRIRFEQRSALNRRLKAIKDVDVNSQFGRVDIQEPDGS